jgi:hypothetical protein
MTPERANDPLPPQAAEPAPAFPAAPPQAARGHASPLLEGLLTASLQEEELQQLLTAVPEEAFTAAIQASRPTTLTECATIAIETALTGFYQGAAGLTPAACRKIAGHVAPLLLDEPASRARLERWLTKLQPASPSTNATRPGPDGSTSPPGPPQTGPRA